MRGTPRLPSSDSISADSSPTSYAPAPVCVITLNSKSVPNDVLAQKALRVSIGDGLLHNLQQIAVLAAQIDEAHLRADRHPAIIVPSITACGSCRKIRWSLHVPGSLSSPLTRTYFGFADCFGTNDHFNPVGKPAPPRPRRFEAFISLMIQSGPCARHFFVGLVSAQLNILIDIGRAHAEPARHNLYFIGMRNKPRHCQRPPLPLACPR